MPVSKTKTQKPQEKMEDAYHLAEEAASETVNTIKNKAKDSLDEGSDKIKIATDQAESIIKERPLLSIGCAFVAGWAISKLIK